MSVKIGRYGPVAQMGEATGDAGKGKPRFASLRPGQHLETITLGEALELFRLPREIGMFEDKKMLVGIGKFGPYVRHDNKFVSLTRDDDPYSITAPRAIELIKMKREKEEKAVLKTFDAQPGLKILQGRWGPYISYKMKNYKIQKGKVAETLSLEDCMNIIQKAPKTKKTSKK